MQQEIQRSPILKAENLTVPSVFSIENPPCNSRLGDGRLRLVNVSWERLPMAGFLPLCPAPQSWTKQKGPLPAIWGPLGMMAFYRTFSVELTLFNVRSMGKRGSIRLDLMWYERQGRTPQPRFTPAADQLADLNPLSGEPCTKRFIFVRFSCSFLSNSC